MALNRLSAAGGVPHAVGVAATDHAHAAPFRARPGRGKRLKCLFSDVREVDSVRGKLSVLYARARADSRVRALQKWSEIDRGTRVGQEDMQQLLQRITRKCAEPAQARVFSRIAERYCERADTEQLAALRRALGTGARDAPAWMADVPGHDAARMAWETLSSTLNGELAWRTLVAPLKQMAKARSGTVDPHTLDLACARLAVGLHRAAGERTGAGLLAAALGQLTHEELRALAQYLAPSRVSAPAPSPALGPAPSPDPAALPAAIPATAAAPGRGPAHCAMAQSLRHLRSSPELWWQRLDLIGQLQNAVDHAVGERVDYFVRSTSSLIDFQAGQGRHGQAIYALAFGSLMKSLDTLRYPGLLDADSSGALVPRLIATALAGKPQERIQVFLAELDIKTLSGLDRAMEGTEGAGAGVAALIRAARDERIRPYRDALDERLRILKTSIDGRERWPIVRGLHELAQALDAWDAACTPHGQEIPRDVQQELRIAVKRALSPLFRSPGNPVGALDRASIRIMCDREVECLRRSEPRLEKYGLALDRDALKEVARERAMPYRAQAVEHAIALIDLFARQESTAEGVVQAVCDGADALATAWAKQASFVDTTIDDAMRLSTDVADEAWRGFVARHPDRCTDARAGMGRLTHILANGLNDAASCLALDIDDECADGDERSRHPASHAAWRLRLGSQLVEALVTVSVPDGEDAVRDSRGIAFVGDWTPALCKAVAEQFGVHYDAVSGQANLVMTQAQHEDFARELLRREMRVPRSVQREISSPAGPIVVEVDDQVVLDIIDRHGTQFSVGGIDRLGRYIPYTSSVAESGDETRIAGADRALLALQRLAGPDAVALMPYLVQSIGADFLKGLFVLGEQSPIKLEDGSSVLPGGGVDRHTDLTRLADGSYILHMVVQWKEIRTATVIADGSGVKLDMEQSSASLACDVHLKPTPEGAWQRQVTSPLMVRYHVVPLAG